MNNRTSEEFMDSNAQPLETARNYYKWIFGLFPFERGKRILDIGCGPCIYYREILDLKPELYLATDSSPYFLSIAERRFGGDSRYQTFQFDVTNPELPQSLLDQRFNYVICFDVLEHLENDEAALNNIKQVMQATQVKYLFVRVPALQLIYGENDLAIGHYRRYSKKSLSSLIHRCGLRINKIQYQNFAGSFPWYFVGKILKRRQAVSSDNGVADEGALINTVSPFLRAVENLIVPPVGLSVYSICEVE